MKKVKIDAIKLAVIRKNYNINKCINEMIKDLPHFEFENIKYQLMDKIVDLQILNKIGAK